MDFITRIEALFDQHGATAYEDARKESVSALEHALQCAQLAEWARADTSLVGAALLHDVGHFFASDPDSDEVDDVHELRALSFLAEGFGPALLQPIALHVQAKRYLVAVDRGYAARLSPASVHSLALQGGPMSAIECARFDALAFSQDAQALRRWDDLAKEPGTQTPPLSYYLALLQELVQPAIR